MAIDKSDAAAARAAAAEKARAAAEKAASTAAATSAAAKAHATTAPVTAKKPVDSVQAGSTTAANRDAVARLGGAYLRQDTPFPPPGTPTFKATDVARNPRALDAGVAPDHGYDAIEDARARRAAGAGAGGTGTTPPADDGSYDQVEQVRAERAHQQALDEATKDLPPGTAQQVKDAEAKVRAAQAGITDPGKRAQATAEAIAQQSAQFKDDPAAAKAFVSTIGPELQSVGRDLGTKGTDPSATVKALAQATGNLGDGASLDLGRAVAGGLPDSKDLNGLQGKLGDEALKSEGGRRLLFSVGKGLGDQGKGAAADSLKGQERVAAMMTFQPGEVIQPVDPKSPDALGQAQLRLEYAKAMPGEFGNSDSERYTTSLKAQLEAFKDDPAARAELAKSQLPTLKSMVDHGATDPMVVRAAFEGAEAAGPDALKQMATDFAAGQGSSRADLRSLAEAVSPRAASELAFAFDKAGNVEQAKTFAAKASTLLDAAATRASEASDKVDRAQAKLNQELAKVGAALTPEQRADYQKRFWAEPDNAKALSDAKAANAALQKATAGDLDTLKRLAAIDPGAAKATSKALGQLARDPAQAQYVQDTAAALVKEPAFQGVQGDLGKAYVGAAQQQAQDLLVQGNTGAALEKLKSTADFLERTPWSSKEMQQFVTDGLPALKDFAGVVSDAVKAGDASRIAAYLQDPAKAKQLEAASGKGGELGQAFAGMVQGVGAGAYLMEAAKTPEASRPDLLKLLKAGNTGAKFLGKGFTMLGQATDGATRQFLQEGTREALGKLGNVIAKVTGPVNLGLQLISEFKALPEAIKDPNVRTVGTAVGTALSAVGAGAALIPGGQLVGGILGGAGFAVSFVSGLIQDRMDENARKADSENLLKQVLAGTPGLSADQVGAAAHNLSHSDASWEALARDGHLTPQQVAQLAGRQPAFDGPMSWELEQVAKYSGLQGQALVDWMAKLPPEAVNFIQNQVVTEQRQGIERSARQTAYDEALKAHDQQGKDFATVEAEVYQREYDRRMKEMLRGYGLIP